MKTEKYMNPDENMRCGSSLELVNCVGNGKIPVEIDVRNLSMDMDFETNNLANGGLFFKFNEDAPVVRLSRSGNFYISGASSIDILQKTKEKVLEYLCRCGILESPNCSDFSVINMVFTFDMHQDIDLNSLALSMGLENVEYEPEQFPGLIYRPDEFSSVILIFASGKLTITGVTSENDAKRLVDHFLTKGSDLLQGE